MARGRMRDMALLNRKKDLLDGVVMIFFIPYRWCRDVPFPGTMGTNLVQHDCAILNKVGSMKTNCFKF